jgi:N utilization substance protein A
MAQTAVSANRLELLQIADSVAREKSIEREVVIAAMEDAIQRAARSRYGAENDIRAEIDPDTGDIRLNRLLEVVDEVEIEAVMPSASASTRNTRTASAISSTASSSVSSTAT